MMELMDHKHFVGLPKEWVPRTEIAESKGFSVPFS